MASDKDMLERLEKIEAGHRDLNGLVADLRDAMIVTAAIESKQADVQKTQAEEIIAAQQQVQLVRESVAELRTALVEVSDQLERPNRT